MNKLKVGCICAGIISWVASAFFFVLYKLTLGEKALIPARNLAIFGCICFGVWLVLILFDKVKGKLK